PSSRPCTALLEPAAFFSRWSALVVVFFFFQAEDGIRDFHVTGVQTCALPIFSLVPKKVTACEYTRSLASVICISRAMMTSEVLRSEERRVGREGRARGSRDAARGEGRWGVREEDGEGAGGASYTRMRGRELC